MINKIKYSLEKFNLNLDTKIVLTEACTGVYSCTPIIADLAGAKKVYALAKETEYGTFQDIEKNFESYFNTNLSSNIKIIKSLNEIDEKIDIVTNSGFIRPIGKELLKYIDSKSVIALMYEPWEFRKSDIDIELMHKNNIKVYGTNEHDNRLMTMDYIGITVLYHLLDYKVTHFSKKRILILGTHDFTEPIERVLKQNNYLVDIVNNYDNEFQDYDVDIFIVAEHQDKREIIGTNEAYINKDKLNKDKKVIHICGNVDFENVVFSHKPKEPKPFGFMSYRTDFVDDMALIDLQVASLLVSEGMLKAEELSLRGIDYKEFVEQNYCGLSFDDRRYW